LTPEAFKDLVQTLGLPLALLVIVLWTGARDMWVFGARYREMRSDRDHYRAHSEELSELLRTSADTTDKALEAPSRRVRGRP
jgi:hypothetical protein